MKTFIVFAMVLAVGGLQGEHAFAELCGDPILDEAHEDLVEAANRECDVYWSDRLSQSGTIASVHVDQALDDATESVLAAVVTGLKDADDALQKLGSNSLLEGRNKPLGRALRVILTNKESGDSLAWMEMNRTGCFIVVDPVSWRTIAGRNGLLVTMAHEFFHCIQYATLPRSLLGAASGPEDAPIRNKWWIEGSAEWYGILAQPQYDRTGMGVGFEFFTDFLALPNFDRPGIAKNGNSQAIMTWPFFAWYSELKSATEVLPFLNSLPHAPHTPENVVRKLEHAEWGDFATRYSAFVIWMSGLGAINPDGRYAQPVREIEEGSHKIDRPAGHMIRERIQLDPGNWAIEATTNRNKGHMFLSRVQGNGDPDGSYRALDQRREVHSVCGEPLDLILVGFGSDPDSTQFDFTAERIDDDCEARCESVPRERASCIVGTWKNVVSNSGGALRNQPGVTELRYPPPTYSFGADGRFSVNNPFYMHKKIDAPPGHDMYQITYYAINANYGYWGSVNNTLGICEQQEVTRGDQTTGLDGQQAAMPLDFDKPISPILKTQFEFKCVDEDTLELKTSSMGRGTMILNRAAGSGTP